MAWFLFVINVYFDFILAAMLAALLGIVAAWVVVKARSENVSFSDVLSRILLYFLITTFGFLFCISYAAARTDPDCSIRQRYSNALRTVTGWFLVPDELLARDGLDKAIRLDTAWVSSAEELFYSIGKDFYSVLTNGEKRRLRFSADSEIAQALFSPNGKKIVLKTAEILSVLDLKTDQASSIYKVPLEEIAVKDARIRAGGIQWSPDSRQVCFFVEKSSQVASQTQWFVYDVKSETLRSVSLASHQKVFLTWSMDSKRLYFSQAVSFSSEGKGQYRIKWFEIPLETLIFKVAFETVYSKMDVPEDLLAAKGIRLYHGNKQLRLEREQLFIRKSRIISPSGRQLFVNTRLQLCYQSAYGVRYRLFGMSPLHEYLKVVSKEQENELEVQDVRWTPSEKYAMLRHYTYGLLVLQPVARKVGVLVKEKVGVFGIYPG